MCCVGDADVMTEKLLTLKHEQTHKRDGLNLRIYDGEWEMALFSTGYTSTHFPTPHHFPCTFNVLQIMLQNLLLRERRLHLVKVLALNPRSLPHEVEHARPQRAGEHLHHVRARVQHLLETLLVEKEVVFAGGDVDVAQHQTTQRHHAKKPLVRLLQISGVIVL